MSLSSRLKTRELQEENTIEGYRQIDRLSYSDLKSFVKDRKKYYKLKILKDSDEIEKDEKSKAASPFIKMGNLVDVRRTDNNNFDKYFVRTEANVPTGQMLILVNHLFNLTQIDKDKEGKLLTSFDIRFQQAYNMLCKDNGGSVKSGVNKFLERFPEEGEEYFREKLNSIGKTIITLEEEQKSDSIVNSLISSVGTKDIVNWEDKVTKYPILFDLYGEPFKSELDQIRFDHEKKEIYLDDYKCTSFVEGFQWQILDELLYLQACIYVFACTQHFAEHPDYKNYRVVPEFNFIVSDQNNYQAPLLFVMTEEHIERAWYDFKVGNKKYKGVLTILEELKFAEENNLWDMSVENYKNKGIVQVPNFETIV